MEQITLTVNGKDYTLNIEAQETLLSVIRKRLGLTGTKAGCGTGECGACVVLLNGKPVNSCMILALETDGQEILTVEGLKSPEGNLSVLQQAFLECGAIQCGFCTSGMLLSAQALLERNPSPNREEIKEAIAGNLCRCTGYNKIIQAIDTAAKRIRAVKEPETGKCSSFIRSDAMEHVTGSSAYIDDITFPNMLTGKILRSPYAHARILGIDTREAEALPGVFAVVTGAEVPEGYFGVDLRDQLVFARDKVRHRGDAVAAVAAVTEETALKALSLIKVDYEPLPAVFDGREAMKPEAPIVHEKLTEYQIGFKTERYGNVCTVAKVRYGDIEEGFKEADLIIEENYETAAQHQCSMETHGAIASFDAYGTAQVWSSTQKPFAMRRYLSQSLKISMNKIRVTASKIGGGFGGKLEMNVEPYALLLARKAGRPVKIIYSREEEFACTGGRHVTHYTIKSGVKKDGTITARQIRFIYDTGAYSGNGPTTTTLVCNVASGLYRVPVMDIEGYCVYTNKMNFGSFRGPSAPQTTFVLESHTDSLAFALDMDPVEFRLKNLLREGEKTSLGQILRDVDYHAVVKEAAEKAGWPEFTKKLKSLHPDKRIGIGISCVFWLSGGWSTSGSVMVNEDGSVRFVTGATDMGTGYLYTSVPQIVGKVLGLLPEEIKIVYGDTDTVGYDHGIGGSRGVFAVGMVAKMAAEQTKKRLFEAAARKWNVRPDCLETQGGRIWLQGNPRDYLTFAEISYEEHMLNNGPVIGTASYLPQMDDIDPQRVKGLSFPAFKGNTIGCHIAVTEVDTKTGELNILRYIAAHDAGKVINQAMVEGQIEGGTALGIGFGTLEEMIFDKDGAVVNPNLADYKLPTALDVPEVETVLCEIPSHYGPFGAKGVSESTMAPTAAAIANSIFNATGRRIRSTPITREKIYWTLNPADSEKLPL